MRFLAACILCACVMAAAADRDAVAGDQAPGSSAVCEPVDADDLLKPVWLRRLFLRVAFVRGESRADKLRLERWRGPIRVYALDPPAWFDDAFARMRAAIECATGLAIDIDDEPSATTNLLVRFRLAPTLPEVTLGENDYRGGLSSAACDSLYFAAPGTDELVGASIYVEPKMRDATQRSCLLRSMLHVLGLASSHDFIERSALSDSGSALEALPPNDRVLLRVLYDPRLEIGMPREEVEARLDAIIVDAIAEMTDRR